MNPVPKLAIAGYRSRIDQEIEKFFKSVTDLLQFDLSTDSQHAFTKLKAYSLRPGKRLRGSLAAAAYDQTIGTTFSESGLRLAVALELIQNYLLIIDDVMDESDLRRGQPALHRLYDKEIHDKRSAELLAVNIGLIAQHLANLALLGTGEKSERIVAASQALHENVTATGFGQIDDLCQRFDHAVTRADIFRKYRMKTSYYTFINPLQAGLSLAGVVGSEVRRQVRAFGEPAGIAFQLHDDYLGIFGVTAETGKSNLDDIREGKLTMLVQNAIEHGSNGDVQELHLILGNRAASEVELNRLREIFNRSGATMYVRGEAKRYADLAKRSAASATIWNDAFKEQLKNLIDYVVVRNR
jgi:geranylgeranyl diphosphate synthase type I